MINIREEIILLMKESFIKDDKVYALWLEGSDGLNKSDEFSDIDFWFDVKDGYEEEILNKSIAILETISKPDFIEYYNHPHPQIFQKNIHLEGTSEFLMLDICAQSHSRGSEGCTFVEGDIAEYPLILFDKENVINIIESSEADEKSVIDTYKLCISRYEQRSRVIKYIRREKYLEAFAYYEKYVCQPIVTLFRLIYTPRHSEYGLVHISDHLPKDVVKRIEDLYRVKELIDIEKKLALADEMFKYGQELLRSKTQKIG